MTGCKTGIKTEGYHGGIIDKAVLEWFCLIRQIEVGHI